MPTQLTIYAFLQSESLAQSLKQSLSSDRYVLTQLQSSTELLYLRGHSPSPCDCLIMDSDPALLPFVKQLHQRGTLFPIVILKADPSDFFEQLFEHPASVEIESGNLGQIDQAIDQAIAKFVNLPLAIAAGSNNHASLRLRQQQLVEKFPDLSCYVVGIHNRNQQIFHHQMPSAERQILLQQLKSDYRQILLNYFSSDVKLKQEIDRFINTAFSSNIPVPQVIEIHMELIGDFSRLLKLEGRGEEVLLDYRLTLIDILAHLCEVYRCSIPKQF